MKACFIGLGYIGLPTAITTAKRRVEIAGVNINVQVVKVTNQGKLHITEPDMREMLREVLAPGHFKACTEPWVGDAYFIVVPAPFERDHEPDVSFVESVTRVVLPLLKEGDLYVIESTSPMGTTERMARLIFSERPELEGKIYVAYCPGRVLLGNVIHELVHNDRVIGSMDGVSTRKAMEFYGQFVKGALHPTNSKMTEMCKLAKNSSRDVQIAFANELSFIYDKAGINVWGLIDLANKHPRVSILRPDCGVGGHCIAVGPYFITAEFPMENRMTSTARETNNYEAFWCTEKVKNAILRFGLKHGRKPVVAIMGLAFKPDIDDSRESPAKGITTEVLQSYSDTDVMVVEPNVSEYKLFKLAPYKKVYGKADIVVFLVDHGKLAGSNYRDDVEMLDFCGTFKR